MSRFPPLRYAPLAIALAAALPAWSGAAAPSLLRGIERGSWELRYRDGSHAAERVCVSEAARLVQLRHPAQPCSGLVVAEAGDDVTVQYTCPGRGYGRTRIRREAPGLLQLESQGIAERTPFEFAAEARLKGPCSG
jgi:hypothetical protein